MSRQIDPPACTVSPLTPQVLSPGLPDGRMRLTRMLTTKCVGGTRWLLRGRHQQISHCGSTIQKVGD